MNVKLIIEYLFFQILIIVPFIGGYFVNKKLADSISITKKLIGINLVSIEPLIVLWSIWGLNLERNLIFLPISGLFIVLTGLILGFLFSKILKISEKRKATFLISSSLSNHGFTMGGFICYLFLGENGLGLSFLFIAFFIPYLFIVIFPYAKLSSGKREYKSNPVRGFLLNFKNMPLYAVIAALSLQSFGISRPGINFPVDILLKTSIAIYYLTLGINFNYKGLNNIIKENVSLVLIKFILLPIITFFILRSIDLNSSIKAVVLIQSFMPAAIYSVITAILFDLDSRLASGLFVINSIIFIIIVIPAMIIIKNFLLSL